MFKITKRSKKVKQRWSYRTVVIASMWQVTLSIHPARLSAVPHSSFRRLFVMHSGIGLAHLVPRPTPSTSKLRRKRLSTCATSVESFVWAATKCCNQVEKNTNARAFLNEQHSPNVHEHRTTGLNRTEMQKCVYELQR